MRKSNITAEKSAKNIEKMRRIKKGYIEKRDRKRTYTRTHTERERLTNKSLSESLKWSKFKKQYGQQLKSIFIF